MNGTQPKGVTSYKETAFGVVSHQDLVPLELQGVKKGLEFIYQEIELNKSVQISPIFIAHLHAVSFGWIFPEWAGKFRTIAVTYSGKEAPFHFRVPELLHNLCADLNTRLTNLPAPSSANFIDEAVHLLAWFQHQFVFIHPFQDYNGRTARLLTVLLLLTLGLPPVEIKVATEKDRTQYLAAMQQGDDGDVSLLERLISDALAVGLDATQSRK